MFGLGDIAQLAGRIAGGIIGGPVGSMIGSMIGDMIGNVLQGQSVEAAFESSLPLDAQQLFTNNYAGGFNFAFDAGR